MRVVMIRMVAGAGEMGGEMEDCLRRRRCKGLTLERAGREDIRGMGMQMGIMGIRI